MAQLLSVEAQVDEVQKALSGTAKSLQSIQRQAVGIIAKGTVKTIKALIKTSGLKTRTGELQKAYRYKVKKDGTEANVFPKAINPGKAIFPKVMTLSYGHDGPTKRASNWHIKALGFVQGGQSYIESGAYENELQKMVDKELDKYWG